MSSEALGGELSEENRDFLALLAEALKRRLVSDPVWGPVFFPPFFWQRKTPSNQDVVGFFRTKKSNRLNQSFQ